ncbi:LysR family transcriptional regulator [Bdellovibrio sp. NC01]|uniref:LysR family transcriptional regulator n=1 Tax=Bdellovibrio sp. NC01 TaxID=2220073 RepID=UPI00115847EC|nr:LysR family transcriptional regulator [Bdellovibrio sp. NC01]QDK37104.1 hypothetical protein DOE51_05610 [Bdellovibrio sp. NC01]
MITYPNLYHLKYFVDAVELGSISGAAQKNLVTHPAISRAISALEKHLGVALLEHQKKSFKVTNAGHKVAEQARLLLAAASGFDSLSLHSDIDQAIEIKIGLSRTLSEAYLTPLLHGLKETFPHATAKVRFGTTHEITEAVANRSIDVGLTIGTLNLPTLRQTAIKKGNFVLIESGPKKNWRNDLETQPFLVTEPRLETEKLKTAYKQRFNRQLPVLFEISSWEVIGQLTQKGIGIGLLPDIALENWKKDSYRIVKSFGFESSYEVFVHTLKSSANNRVLDYVIREAHALPHHP